MKELGGKFARYHGRLYRANDVSGQTHVLLVAYGDKAPEPDFESLRPGTWRKQALRSDLEEYYHVQFGAIYRGLDCVADREGDDGRLWLIYLLGDRSKAEAAGFEELEYGVWGRWVDRQELDAFTEMRHDLLYAN
jgi:hypothetical protein